MVNSREEACRVCGTPHWSEPTVCHLGVVYTYLNIVRLNAIKLSFVTFV